MSSKNGWQPVRLPPVCLISSPKQASYFLMPRPRRSATDATALSSTEPQLTQPSWARIWPVTSSIASGATFSSLKPLPARMFSFATLIDLSCDLAFRLGRAATKFLGPDICVGRDTRLSGTMLESALTAGIMAEGGRPHCCGVIPTPAVALLTVQNELDGGIVISASHNPPEFNGIKFFSRKGMKLPDAVEEEISAWVMSEEAMAADTLPTGAGVGHIIKMKDARKAYVDHAIDTLDGLRLDGLVVAVDCGHGASCQTTPAALQRLGATVHAINTDYCGTDINVECGSTHLEPLRELVLRTHADIGLAHDGDADRVLFVDSEGNEIDGDYILAICGSDLAARGKLANSEIVSTVMCNLGFSIAMKEQGFEMVQTAVGDRYVLERMLADGAVIGGEQSGHIIFLEHNTTGDGLVTALQLLAVLKRTGRTLTDRSASSPIARAWRSPVSRFWAPATLTRRRPNSTATLCS